MALKDKLPTLEKGSSDLGGQLRQLLAVVVELCEAEEARIEAAKAPEEAPKGASDDSAQAEAVEAAKPASKPPVKAAAK